MEDRIREIFSEPQHRTNRPILATFGMVSNTMGYFVVNMEHPIAQFKGTTITRSHIPKTIRYEVWPKTMKNFKNSLAGTSSLQDPRNGLCYPLYSVNYSNPHAMLPRGYEPTEQHALLGMAFLQASGKESAEILESALGILSHYTETNLRSFQNGGLQKALVSHAQTPGDIEAHIRDQSVALTLTTGLALHTLIEKAGLNQTPRCVSPRRQGTPLDRAWSSSVDYSEEITGLDLRGMAQSGGEAALAAWEFVEDVVPETAKLLQVTFESTRVVLDVTKSLLRKSLRSVGFSADTAQDIADVAVLGAGTFGVGKTILKSTAKKARKMEAPLFENQTPYNPRAMKEILEKQFGTPSYSSVPDLSKPNVKLAGQRHSTTGIVFDQRGYPIYDHVTIHDTRLPRSVWSIENPGFHMSEATKDLKAQIQSGNVNRNKFTEKQLKDIFAGKIKIDGYTWHHHQDLGRMQLIEEKIHQKTAHVGGMDAWF
ncbi:hypothetical protein AWC38_SpisGene25349 [Stylophora pistillata]|uniref:Uncharacterized protein n=1 Tax=Stylophora pistillata TaxID=50429 RepID=A0A2B4R3Q3_STYPI|nr:hypothetical protein AWC38_SpisGene25349 [Stylophora pistillata]